MTFSKTIQKLANAWHKRNAEVGHTVFPDAEERRHAYILEREEAYQRIVAAHVAMGTLPPDRSVLG